MEKFIQLDGQFNCFMVENIGVSGTTPVLVKYVDNQFVARMGIALFGSTNMKEEHFKACNYDPFHEKFFDNFAEGKGKTKEEAIEQLKYDIENTSNSLWI